jgi:hypothetical protein
MGTLGGYFSGSMTTIPQKMGDMKMLSVRAQAIQSGGRRQIRGLTGVIVSYRMTDRKPAASYHG